MPRSADMEKMQATRNQSRSIRRFSTLRCSRVLFAGSCLLVAVVSIYWNSLEGSWHYDDAANITNNPAIQIKQLSWGGLSRAIFEGHVPARASFRPVAYLSFALNFYYGGLNVFGYHLINLMVHFLSSLFLFLVAYRILNLPRFREKYAVQSYPAALLGAFFWAIHPIQTQAVTYVVQRMALLAGLFYILSMYLYLRARTEEGRSRKVSCFAGAFAAFLLALGSKENAIMLLPSLALCEILLLHDDGAGFLRKNKKTLMWMTGLILFLGILYLSVGGVYRTLFAGYDYRDFSMAQRLMTETRVMVFYLSLLIYPTPERLSIAHDIRVSTSMLTPMSTLAATLFIFASLAALIWIARRQPIVSFSYLFFFINHVTESTLLPLDLVYEHRNYLPSMFFFLPPALGLIKLMEWKGTLKYPLAAFMVLLLISFGHWTYLRNMAWESSGSLWQDAAKKAPRDSRVHHNLGVYFQKRGNLQRARAHFEVALRYRNYHRQGGESLTQVNLGNLYRDLNDEAKAEKFYRAALESDPNQYHALIGLATLYERRGDQEQAYQSLMRGFSINPNDPMVNIDLGLSCLRAQQPDQALEHFKNAVKEGQVDPRVLLYLGMTYKQKGRLGLATIYLRKALELNPSDVSPHLHLMEIYRARGLDGMAREKSELLVSRFVAQPDLLKQVIKLIVEKGSSGEVHLSGKVIFPLLHDALEKQNLHMHEFNLTLQKAMEREGIAVSPQNDTTMKSNTW
jgi:tetratricopeptide (TPR) repeat protein